MAHARPAWLVMLTVAVLGAVVGAMAMTQSEADAIVAEADPNGDCWLSCCPYSCGVCGLNTTTCAACLVRRRCLMLSFVAFATHTDVRGCGGPSHTALLRGAAATACTTVVLSSASLARMAIAMRPCAPPAVSQLAAVPVAAITSSAAHRRAFQIRRLAVLGEVVQLRGGPRRCAGQRASDGGHAAGSGGARLGRDGGEEGSKGTGIAMHSLNKAHITVSQAR